MNVCPFGPAAIQSSVRPVPPDMSVRFRGPRESAPSEWELQCNEASTAHLKIDPMTEKLHCLLQGLSNNIIIIPAITVRTYFSLILH